MIPDFDPKAHQAIIFDCDGTLADTMGLHFVAWSAIAQRYALSFPRERFFSLAGVPTAQIVEVLARDAGVTLDIDAVCGERDALFMETINRVKAVAPVAAIAQRWRTRVPMAVASGSQRDAVRATLSHLSMTDWFDPVLGAEDTARGKPAPDVFLLAAERMGVAPEKCVVYEDSDKGIEAAHAANMAAVDVRPWHTPWWPG